MSLIDIFVKKSVHLTWFRLPDDHVVTMRGGPPVAPPPALLQPRQAYFKVRLREMFVRYARKLWKAQYPVLHAFTAHAGREEQVVAGPGQLRALGEANLDRIVNLNQHLAGPTPFMGGDVSLVVGLYSVPGTDAAKALIDTVGSIASLGGFGGAGAIAIANVVKAGVEQIIGLDKAELQLGVRDSFYEGQNPLRPGHYVGVAAEAVGKTSLWLKDGRLVTGRDPVAAVEYNEHDYFVIELETLVRRDDWPSLAGIGEFQDKFNEVLAEIGVNVQDKRQKLNRLWPEFQAALNASKDLTDPDRARIALDVSENLKKVLARMTTIPFDVEEKGPAHESVVSGRVSFIDMQETDARSTPAALTKVLSGDPF